MPSHSLVSDFRCVVLSTVAMILACGCAEFESSANLPQPSPEVSGQAERLAVGEDGSITHENVDFLEALNAPGKTVIVDFWATWCGPCRMLAPELEKVAKESGGQVVVLKVNVDEEAELAAQFGISGIPDMRIFRDQQPVSRILGFRPAAEIRKNLPQ
ncbi:MAG: thioredoxin [Planctomycetaceae bacterium]